LRRSENIFKFGVTRQASGSETLTVYTLTVWHQFKKRNMRNLNYLLILLLIGCKSNRVIENKLADYQYPLDSLISPKVFIFQRTDSLDKLSYHYQQLIKKDNQKILIRSSLGVGDMRDSSVYFVIDKHVVLKESYMIIQDKKTNQIKASKGDIKNNEDNGLNIETKIKYVNPFYESMISTVDFKLRYDTLFSYRLFDKDLPCIRYKANLEVSIKHKYIPLIGKDINKHGEYIYAKNVGLIYYSFTDDKDKSGFSWRLKEIIDYNDFLKK
jgi:hypothetical protein